MNDVDAVDVIRWLLALEKLAAAAVGQGSAATYQHILSLISDMRTTAFAPPEAYMHEQST